MFDDDPRKSFYSSLCWVVFALGGGVADIWRHHEDGKGSHLAWAGALFLIAGFYAMRALGDWRDWHTPDVEHADGD